MRVLFSLFLFFIVFHSAQAKIENPGDGKITGRVIDSMSNQPIEYATIGLYLQGDNKVVNGTTSDSRGIFKITKVPKGIYKMSVNFIGYGTNEKTNIVISKESSNLVLGDIHLTGKQTLLKEVAITAEKSIIENKIDKVIYNVEKDITSQSGVASDVLKKVPQVSVDVDGNVELQGNSNIRFLINGKPSALFGSNIADVLQSVPSNQIQSIEIITSPGVKYDAEGTGGIINILMKKSTAQGMNGNISLSAGTRLENGTINLNVRKGKFGINAFIGENAQLLSGTINTMNRSSHDLSTSSLLLQNGSGEFSRNGNQSGIGFDWEINPTNNITGTFGYNYFSNHNVGTTNRQNILWNHSGNELSDIFDLVNTTTLFHSQIIDFSLNYKKKFKQKDQELEVTLINSNAMNYSHYEQAQQNITSGELLNSSFGNNPGYQKELNFTVNYSYPLGNEALIETGVKSQSDHINGVSDVYLLNSSSSSYEYNSSLSSELNYKRYVYAGYLSAAFKIFRLFDIKAGFRDEYTAANANLQILEQ